ncbi:hypothetical protein KAU51_04420 [Candidatus Parcubacteria bacterium]|nr:hypothetical protein [Candidatus Parcubacteria bacterium]
MPPTPIPDAENIIFIDLLHADNGDKQLLVFQDGVYYGTFNYSDTILFNPNVSYTIIIEEDYIDLIQDESFFTHIFSRYGNIFISLIMIVCLIGVIVFVYNKTKR